MPFGSYSDLLTSIDNWLGQRSELVPIYPDFVTLAEQRMYRELRAREMLQRSKALLNEQYEWLPYDFLKMKRVTVSPGSQSNTSFTKVRLTGMTVGQLDAAYGDDTYTVPEAYCVEGRQIRFGPAPTPPSVPIPPDVTDVTPYRNFEITYYARFVPLSSLADQGQTTVILDYYPELYLYGSLIEAEPYLIDDQRIMVWKGLWDDAINRINAMAELDSSSAMAVGLDPQMGYSR